ncbi:pantoate--beta-alanine ligase [Tichowtungia aerotolerans]|uniref:Pantothenate synthetase n=1 Tax=Tichowtungia aerotolerans TaxID=2697043 RepID=A0A6P1MFX5_9BACT|nr:pantoate--beta-alanine ligase [Tichowtungia aerotolerans]QHI69975.1 pantoate--beta-alanine ligase [Tichowtungia aerotolerans]
MKIIQSPAEMQSVAQAQRREGKTIGFVPTMGFLHEGHLSLMHSARARCDVLVASIFVNPTQFGPNEDLDAYPRDFERDEKLCREAGVDFLFYPTPENMYLDGHSIWVDEESLSGVLCGTSRPGHFRGVCTVVAKLLHIALPDFMVLGEKDAQQLRVLRRMVRDLNFPVEIVSGPTIREPDGLAKSSRNKYLRPEERAEAVCLFQGLEKAKELYSAGEREANVLKNSICEIIRKTSGSIDYVEIVDDETLKPVQTLNKPVLVALAVRFPGARLIDNAVLGK